MNRGRLVVLALLAASVACGEESVTEDRTLMSAADALALPRPEADHLITYGESPLHFGELRLPEGEGPHPVVVVIHGGCWLAQYDLGYMSAFAEALTRAGLATWSIEYRRVGDDGGGWPGTLMDAAAAVDYLGEIGHAHDLDLERVTAVGHSAGGHLALWLAGRTALDGDDPLHGDVPVALNGVVSLAGITDLAEYAAPEGCGAAVPELLGGDPGAVVERLKKSSPIEMVPLGIPQTLIIGEHDPIVPVRQAEAYREAAWREGDVVPVIEIPGAGHFELVDPTHPGFQVVLEEIMRSLELSDCE
jgi:acetyl esterase/lipase